MIRWLFFLIFIPHVIGQEVHPIDNEAFLQNEVASIYVDLPNDQLQLLLVDSLYTDHEFLASLSKLRFFGYNSASWISCKRKYFA